MAYCGMVVMNTIWMLGSTLRSRCAASMPVMPGMSMSIITREKREMSDLRKALASEKRWTLRGELCSSSKALM
jgi:hypothetical protein